MKFIKLTAIALLGMVVCLQVNGQNEEQMKAWQEYMEPGAMHKMMASWDGEWDEEITHWMEPGAEATQSKATCVNKTILGGRYSEARHTGNFFGMPFEGISLLAYDNAKKVFSNSRKIRCGNWVKFQRMMARHGSENTIWNIEDGKHEVAENDDVIPSSFVINWCRNSSCFFVFLMLT